MPEKNYDCRPACLWGSWLIQQDHLDQYEAAAWSIIEANQLEAVARETREQVERARAKPYEVDENGVAHFAVSDPLTKYPNSFQSALGGTSTLMLRHALAVALNDSSVRAAFMDVDSGGGTVMGTAEAAADIRKFAKKKPTHIHISGMGTSAAYWLAIQGSFLSAEVTAYVGSVGTMAILTDRSEQLKRMGITKHLVTNPGADKKGTGADGQPVTEAQKKEIQHILRDLTEPFAADVQQRRDLPDSVMAEVKKAGVYVGKSALDKALIDALGFTTEAYDHLVSKLGGGKGNPAGMSTKVSETQRTAIMPLTTEQLTKVQKFPGLASATAEDGADKLIAAFDGLQASAATLDAKAKAQDTEIATLKAAVASAKPAAAPLSDREKEMATKIVKMNREKAQATGGISPACADAVQAAVGDLEVTAKVFEALAGNVAAPKPGEKSKSQVILDDKKGDTKPDEMAAATAEAAKWQAEQARARGLQPIA